MSSEKSSPDKSSVRINLTQPLTSPVKGEAQHAAPAGSVSSSDRLLSNLISWLPWLSFAFMVYSATNAIYESKGDCSTVLFVGGSFSLLALLYLSMWEFEKTRNTPSKRNGTLKVAIWLLSVALTALFSYRVTTLSDSAALTVFVWSVSALTSAFGYYFLFLCNENTPGFPA